MKTILTIAGSDPGGGAGVQADLRVFTAHGLHGLSVLAALTAQNTQAVTAVLPVEPEFIRKQLDTLLEDITPEALKTGMLYTEEAVAVVAEACKTYGLKNLVVDPVAVSSSGTVLAREGVLECIKQLLFPMARVVTPNMQEAALLSGREVVSEQDMAEAAKAIKDMGPEAVVLTGGHLQGRVMNLMYDGREMHKIEGDKLQGQYHGTGCAFSASLASQLALGLSMLEAAKAATEFVAASLKSAYMPGKGMMALDFSVAKGEA